ncbi:MAG: porin [Paracoccaceae bacterium]
MKKILLATTALVGFAGAAAAEIKLDGYAEIGIDGGNNGYETQFHNDWQVNFNFSSETDGGLSFGGKVQIEETNSPAAINGGLKIDDEAFWVSGSFGKVTLGETKGALDWAVPDVYSGSAISDDHSTHAGAYWNTGLDGIYDDQIARYEYSFGDYGVAFSIEQDDTGVGDPVIGLGGKWSGNLGGTDVSAGIGYQTEGDASTWSIAGQASLAGGFSVSLGYAGFDNDVALGKVFNTGMFVGNGVPVESWYGVGVAYTTGALTVGANYSMYSVDSSAVAPGDSYDDPKGWGLVVNYDLGGGAVVMAGYGSSSGSSTVGGITSDYGAGNGHGDNTWSIGLGMSF